MLGFGPAGPSRAPGVHVPYPVVSGDFVSASVNGTALGAVALAANQLDYALFHPMRDLTIDQLAVEVTTFGAGSLHVGVYDLETLALLAGTGETPVDTGTSNGVRTLTVSLTLRKDRRYGLAWTSDGTAAMRAIPIGGSLPAGSPPSGGNGYAFRRVARAFAALPAAMPAITALGASTLGQLWIRMRVA